MGGAEPRAREADVPTKKGALLIELVILAVVVAVVILVMQPWKW